MHYHPWLLNRNLVRNPVSFIFWNINDALLPKDMSHSASKER